MIEQNFNPEPTLIKNINSFINDPFFQLRCLNKTQIINYDKYYKKGVHQKYTFCDIESKYITAISFDNDTKELDKKIQKGLIYNIRGAYIKKLPVKLIKLNENFSEYQLTFKNTTEIELVNDIDYKKFFQPKIINIKTMINLPIRTYVKFAGIILNNSGIINFKKSMSRKLIVGDNTLYKIEVSLWNKYTNFVFKVGDVIMFNKLTVYEYKCMKILRSIDNCTEINTIEIPEKIKIELTNFYLKYKNLEDYTDINDKYLEMKSEKIFIKELFKINNIISSNKNINTNTLEITGKIIELIPAKNINNFFCYKCFNVSKNETCLKCNIKLKPFFRFLLQIQDCSGNMWIEIYGYLAERFLNIKIIDYQNNILGNEKSAKEFFEKIKEKKLYKTYSFFGKKREERDKVNNIENEEYKIIFSVYKILEVNKEYYHQLLKIVKGE